MGYDDQIKDQVRFANDIVDVISQVVPLKRSGKNFKACCPFHQEKSPSFMVHPEKQIFRCFGCGAGGDVFSFVMRHENLNFPEVLRMLAERAGITLPALSSAERRDQSNESEQLYDIYREAANYYHANFLHPAKGRLAREYFFKRGYDEAVAKEFKIGWSEEGWQGLFEFLSKKGFQDTLLLKSGLVHRSPKGTLYDAFRARLLFPIASLQGKVVAFGGRILGPSKDGPKYLNSPESSIFHKRRELFGLYLAKKFIPEDRSQILVTEGYFDFLRLYHQGFKNVVATLGTALTDDHVQLIRRFADEAVVIYDGDKAGEAASLRGLEVFLEGDLSVKLVKMPEGFDPDDLLLKKGPEEFKRLLDQAQDFFDYKLGILLQKHNRWDTLGLKKITEDLLETLAKVKSPVMIDRYLNRLASSLGVEAVSLRQELQKIKSKTEKRPAAPTVSSIKGVVDSAPIKNEILLVSLLMDSREIRDLWISEVDPQDFKHPVLKKLVENIHRVHAERQDKTWLQWMDQIDSEELRSKMVTALDFESSMEEKKKSFQDSFSQLRKWKHTARLEELRKNIIQAERSGSEEALQAYMVEYQELLKSKNGMGNS